MDLLKQNNEYLAKQNDRLIDLIVGLVCVGGGFVAGVISYFY